MDMKFEEKGHVVVEVAIVAAVAVAGCVEAIEGGVVAAHDRAVADRLVQMVAVDSVDVTDHDRR